MKRAIIYGISVLSAVLSVSCSLYDIDQTFAGDGTIALRFTADGGWSNIGCNTDTRSKPGLDNESVIEDVWVFQFDGVDENSLLATPPRYVEDLDKAFAFVNMGNNMQRVVIVANTGESNYPWSLNAGESSYSTLLTRVRNIAVESDLHNAQGNLLLFGQVQLRTDGSVTSAVVPMKHNAVKLDFNIVSENPDIVIDRIQLCNIPSKQWLVPEGVQAPFPAPRSVNKISYEAVPVTLTDNKAQYVWYMPANMQGTVDNDNAKSKNVVAPKDATYVKINAFDASSGNAPVEYVFYPGANFTNDFNLTTNNHYLLTVTIHGVDDYEVDSRIAENRSGRVVDMAGKTANCYILNPPGDGDPLKYRIYPSQVDLYWGKYEDEPDYLLNNNVGWTVELLWQDRQELFKSTSPTDYSVFLSKATGTGINDYFELEVPSGVYEGNFTLHLYRTADPDKTTLWAWHMWVTDYDPDISLLAPVDTQFIYGVENGNVHRYQGKIWTEGIYRNRFIMDRNIGQLNSNINNNLTTTSSQQGSLYYQYGRKDPFPYLSNSNSAFTEANAPANLKNNMTSVHSPAITPVVMRDVIMNPSRWYTYGLLSVVHDIKAENATIYRVWRDKYTHMLPSEVYVNDQKSIYDPCPYGWKLPNIGTFEDFVANKTVNNETRGLKWSESTTYGRGLRYWPYIKVGDSYPVDGDIRFPMNGRINYSSVSQSYATSVYLWYSSYCLYSDSTSKPADASSAFMSASYVSQSNNSATTTTTSNATLSYGINVRCVSHNR